MVVILKYLDFCNLKQQARSHPAARGTFPVVKLNLYYTTGP
jgi:hypothetical protein